jgi:phage-related protein
MERLRDLGHELRRPEADYLRDGIYELRASVSSMHHRILYFFHGNAAVVVSHGLEKEREVPQREIEKAISRKARYEADPEGHSHEEG